MPGTGPRAFERLRQFFGRSEAVIPANNIGTSVADRTFIWKNRAEWLAAIPEYAGSMLTTELAASLRKKKADCWSDSLSWLPPDFELDEFQAAFANHYIALRGFHGCRPASVRSYFEKGFLGQSGESIVATFKTIFHDIPSERLDAAIADLEKRGKSERGKIYFCSTSTTLIEHCGHYMIQGSEYLMSLAAALSRHRYDEDYTVRLRYIGVPTIFEVDIPTEYLPPLQLPALARVIVSAWGQQAACNDLGFDEQPCLIVHRPIEAEHIRGHFHPEIIRDPHQGGSAYRVSADGCDVCGSL